MQVDTNDIDSQGQERPKPSLKIGLNDGSSFINRLKMKGQQSLEKKNKEKKEKSKSEMMRKLTMRVKVDVHCKKSEI